MSKQSETKTNPHASYTAPTTNKEAWDALRDHYGAAMKPTKKR